LRTHPDGLKLSTCESIRDVGEADYGRLLGEDAPPFLAFPFLDALETTGCVAPERGWAPLHLVISRGSEPVAIAPAYVKGNSEGEFVFDHAWARFAQVELGIDYYPKLILAVPFTPATGPRVLTCAGNDRGALVTALVASLPRLLQSTRLSGAHVLFPHAEETEELERRGLLVRHGLQFHWENPGYQTFEDFLGRFTAKRRNQIRRERREMEKQGIEIKTYTGQDIGDQQVADIYAFYRSTVDKFFWGRRYLNREFFDELKSRMSEQLHIVLAYERGSKRALAGAFNLLGKRALYGRYWGAREERPFLHFNVCFYHSIEECIRRKIARFEPGAGGEHKQARGFEPTLTHSAHYLKDARLSHAIADFLRRERDAHVEHVAECRRDPVLKPL
jgi:uncharacterized protein